MFGITTFAETSFAALGGNTFSALVSESAFASDVISTSIYRFWVDVNDVQTANWADIVSTQTPTWVSIDTTSSDSWVLINTQ